jgi:hypothetical protein
MNTPHCDRVGAGDVAGGMGPVVRAECGEILERYGYARPSGAA